MSRLVLLAVLALAVAVPSAGAGVGPTRLLVVRLTWRPPVASAEEVRVQIAKADAFLWRSSSGRAALTAHGTPVVDRFTAPTACFAGANEDSGLGALSLAAHAAASRLRYDLTAYDRFILVFSESVCGRGVGRDVLLASPARPRLPRPRPRATPHLPPATRGSADCATCAIREYGDRFSVMGQGATEFSALWLEHRLSPTPRVSIRLVRRPPGGGAVRPIYLAGGRSSAVVKGLLRIRTVRAASPSRH